MVTTVKLVPNLPTQDELPYDDGVPMESPRHKMQLGILMETLTTWLEKREDGFIGGDMFVYFSNNEVKTEDFKGPDFFAVLGVPKGERKSWVVWQEGKGPDVVVELLSESTAKKDKTTKKTIYQNQMKVPEYFWYDPFDPGEWRGFKLINGVYEPLELVEGGYISEKMNLKLVLWEGNYEGLNIVWLRWATLEGELLPTREEKTQRERAEKERERAEKEWERAEKEREREQKEIAEALVIQERQQKEIAEALAIQERQQKEIAEALAIQERQKTEKLAAYLRSLGINPDEI
ncbi:Uma2 family endonuclease [Cylindrospermopsis raciborskii]|uniref:Uma2 family endonuclease n=1 Tax=Cylindrospermopsis raciborskii TaxID=77022 RepID=UPI000778DEA8|nr:Uma2 family endonuclease [Cylindrospermopsis raciborskii]MCZ2207827.1 Uma2 family endonuclease [Cylindrospermopsis raciborskii PAMP2011]